LCKDQECFVVSKGVCDKLDRTMGQQHPEMARQCQQLSSYLVDQMKLALESGTIAADFKADSAKLSSLGIVGGERKVVKPDSLGASAKSIFALSFECQNMRLYNGPQSQGTQSSAAGRSQ
jgi:hypothetical protein